MIHKREGMPSKGWLLAYLRRYENQRISFQLAPGGRFWEFCVVEGAFSRDLPLMVSGVYTGLHKRPKAWPDIFASGDTGVYSVFRGPIFRQGAVFARHPFSRSHYDHRRGDVEFELSEMMGCGLAEKLRSMTPRLGQTPGRINCSEGF